jgi:hypothetical protein
VALPENGALRVLYLILVSVIETPAGPEAINILTGSGAFVIGTRGGIWTAASGGGEVICAEEMGDCAGTVVGGTETVGDGVGRGRIGLELGEGLTLTVDSAKGVGETKAVASGLGEGRVGRGLGELARTVGWATAVGEAEGVGEVVGRGRTGPGLKGDGLMTGAGVGEMVTVIALTLGEGVGVMASGVGLGEESLRARLDAGVGETGARVRAAVGVGEGRGDERGRGDGLGEF